MYLLSELSYNLHYIGKLNYTKLLKMPKNTYMESTLFLSLESNTMASNLLQ